MEWLSSLGLIGEVLRFIILIIEVIIVFNLMILVHEYGHFLAARWRGLKVEKFQIWFGKPLWKKTINGVQYGLGSIPAGGFVALPQMAPMDAIEGGPDTPREALPPISPLDKIIVAFAGPLFSFMLAVFFALLVWKVGKPQSEGLATRVVGFVQKDSPADKAGLKPGDEIITVDGHAVKRFEGLVDSVRWAVVASEGDSIPFEIERPGEGRKLIGVKDPLPKTEPVSWWKSIFQRPPLRDVGIEGKQTPMVARVQKDSPAQEAGLQPNDLVIKADGMELRGMGQLGEHITSNKDKPIKLLIERNGSPVEVTITPRLPDKRPADWTRQMIGVEWDAEGKRMPVHPTPREQITDAVRHMKNLVQKLFSRKSDLSPAHMSGPLGIFRLYYKLFEHPDGWRLVLWFSVVFNINLAILNMLPFPVLDGGHITMAIAEAIRRKPLQSRLLEAVQTACALMLLGFMIFVTLKDTGDLFKGGGGKGGAAAEIQWLPKEQRDLSGSK
jgi:regulator of sigma E protease